MTNWKNSSGLRRDSGLVLFNLHRLLSAQRLYWQGRNCHHLGQIVDTLIRHRWVWQMGSMRWFGINAPLKQQHTEAKKLWKHLRVPIQPVHEAEAVTPAHTAGLLGGALGRGPPLERIIWLLVTAQIVLQEVCTGSQPKSTLHLASCQKTNEQIVPLSGCSLPSPYTCNLHQSCAWSKTRASGAAVGLGAWKKTLTQPRKKQGKEDWSTAWSHPACGAGPEHWAAGFPTLLSCQFPRRWTFHRSTSPLGSRSPVACIRWTRYGLWGTISSCGIKHPLWATLEGFFTPICSFEDTRACPRRGL